MNKIKALIFASLILLAPSIVSAGGWWFTTDDGKQQFNLELAEVFERHGR